MGAWLEHDGKGRPVPIGTLVDIRHFNGEVSIGMRVGGMCFAADGTPIPGRGRWSGWDHHDGGPMGPKFTAYRVADIQDARERNTALFRSWLDVRELVGS